MIIKGIPIISNWFPEYDHEFTRLKWPPQSLDLILIEHIWTVAEKKICIMHVKLNNLQKLCEGMKSIWTKISDQCLQHLFESMPGRIKVILKAKSDQIQ